MKFYSIRCIVGTLLLGVAGTALSQMADPTRPPGASAGGSVGAGDSGPVLQSVIISPQGRSAIIGGETVKLNDKYGDARVIRITENEVVLRSATGTETLRMYPDISMKPAAKPPTATGAAQKKGAPAKNKRGKEQ